jgi:hypothetical protein
MDIFYMSGYDHTEDELTKEKYSYLDQKIINILGDFNALQCTQTTKHSF